MKDLTRGTASSMEPKMREQEWGVGSNQEASATDSLSGDGSLSQEDAMEMARKQSK